MYWMLFAITVGAYLLAVAAWVSHVRLATKQAEREYYRAAYRAYFDREMSRP